MSRSKEFDVNEVLDKAMILFWDQGYEKTSMSDLVTHMGIHRRSLYDTFGDKHSLFLQAITRYMDKVKANLTSEIKPSKTATEALYSLFQFMILDKEDLPSGCLIVNSVTELAARDAEVNAKSIESFEGIEDMFEQIILWGQQDGEFTSKQSAKELAKYLHTVSIGIRVMGRSSVDKAQLSHTIDVSINLLKS
ncbi:TetR/AcrR family transcriptional regulator [Paenibacillus sp. PsM32]|uniref:TetR/AcrR family transcriptional regulator n=1 Tax=Paenibacillus sp. PsM32 TaxID=3030536 RepID=UPI00263B7C4B|nr:TetR/AcrR family transcriptional regulator [Paenibacillus sp. PsM32]MDN4618165.1 TetR/AcrR family transcriptional regulator [Paenibacillus sp. PsM32]